MGNRLTRDAGGALEAYGYDAFSNRLDTVTAGGVTRTLTYTASGNTETDDNGAGTILTLVYDSTDRLVEVKNGVATTASYQHNADGVRVAKTVGSATTQYIFSDGAFFAETDGASGTAQSEYVWLGDVPLAFIQGGVIYFVHSDHLNTPQRITDGSGAVVWDADRRPFGETTVSGLLTFNLRFPGQYHDSETALHYNRMRDYDPRLGRYVQSDAAGLDAGWNTYAYASGNPVKNFDISGREDIDTETPYPYDGWPVLPYSNKHIRRNENNWCPSSPPEKDCDSDTYCDHLGWEWTADNPVGEVIFHGGWKGYDSWRRSGAHGISGWQCTYNGDQLVTSGQYQGTFDYRAPNIAGHYMYDVAPHIVNDNYVDYLTVVY